MKIPTYLNMLAIVSFVGAIALLFLGSSAGDAFIVSAVLTAGSAICKTIEKQKG